MQCKLFYDKFAIDHHYNNALTKSTSIEDLEDGSYFLYTGKDAMKFYNSKFKSNFQIPEIAIDSDLYTVYSYTKTIDGIESIYSVVSVNTIRLEKIIKVEYTEELEFLKKLCRYHLSYTNSNRLEASIFYSITNKKVDKIQENVNFMVDKIMESIDYTFHEKINNQSDLTIDLFDYQKCSINWMLEKEKNTKRIYYNINEEVILQNVYYDVYNQSFKLLKDRNSLHFYGGGLIDEVGL
jgi:hypothetical protein